MTPEENVLTQEQAKNLQATYKARLEEIRSSGSYASDNGRRTVYASDLQSRNTAYANVISALGRYRTSNASSHWTQKQLVQHLQALAAIGDQVATGIYQEVLASLTLDSGNMEQVG